MTLRSLPALLLVSTLALSARAEAPPVEALGPSIEKARDAVYPALVNIGVIADQYRGGRAMRVPGQGSGVIVTAEGHVLTNFHVAENASRIQCSLVGGEVLQADVVVDDPLTDLSVLKLRVADRAPDAPPLPFARLGDSDALVVGERVIALGNPRGLDSSLTLGVVSSTSRVFKTFTGSGMRGMELSEGQPTGLFTRWIQHDAMIQPGNSGGPLVNMKGEVIGINELGGTGIAFAIPSNLARNVLDRALKHGRIDRGWLGVTVQPVGALGLETGALVASVQPGHAAEKAGLRPGDILLRVGTKAVQVERFEDVPRFYAFMAELEIGSSLPLLWRREGEEQTGEIRVERMEAFRGEERMFPVWGVTATSITGPMAFVRHLPDTSGVLLTGIRPGKPPEVARPSLQPGDIVLAIGGETVTDLASFAALLKQHRKTKDLLVRFLRGRRDMVTALDMTRKPPSRSGRELPKAWLGVQTQVLTPAVARALGLEGKTGLRIVWVLPGTSAERAGLRPGDIVVSLDDEPIQAFRLQDAEILRRKIEELDIGQTVTFGLLRKGVLVRTEVALEETPETIADVRSKSDDVLEYTVRELTYLDKVANAWPLDAEGVLVKEVESGGWAHVAGLRAGDLLLEIQGHAVETIQDFQAQREALHGAKPKRVVLFVRRGRSTTFVFPEPEWPVD